MSIGHPYDPATRVLELEDCNAKLVAALELTMPAVEFLAYYYDNDGKIRKQIREALANQQSTEKP